VEEAGHSLVEEGRQPAVASALAATSALAIAFALAAAASQLSLVQMSLQRLQIPCKEEAAR